MQGELNRFYLEGRRRRAAEEERRREEFVAARRRYCRTPSETNCKAILAAINECSMIENSGNRLFVVLDLINGEPPEIFWPALMDAWSVCDATWPARSNLLRAMKNANSSAIPFFSPSQREFFDALPPEVKVFRGCSRPRVRAVAWTTDRAVAEGFAHGHRGISVPDPVIASAVIPKEHVFFVIPDEREEKEIVLDPHRLRKVAVEPFTARQREATAARMDQEWKKFLRELG